ncbi:hypothetical protein [Microcoleus sp. D2_18a_B4]
MKCSSSSKTRLLVASGRREPGRRAIVRTPGINCKSLPVELRLSNY